MPAMPRRARPVMTSDGDALLRAVLVDPADDLPRLAYADWLDERGEVARAEFIRLQLELGRIGHGPDRCRRRRCPCRQLSERAGALGRAGAANWLGVTAPAR